MLPTDRKRLFWPAVKLALAAAVVVGVAVYFARILANPALAGFRFTLRPEYLLPAGVLYLAAHTCWATFWVRLLRYEGVAVTWFAGIRAYFVSQIGKYIPGKVWVIGIRVGMLGTSGRSRLAVGVTATYETLTSMAAGAMLGVLLLPWLGVLPADVAGKEVALVAVAGLPLLLGVMNRLAVRIAAKTRSPDAPPLPSPSIWLLAQGLLHGAVGWCLLGVSLGLTARSVLPNPPGWDVDGYLADLAAAALSYVLGFVVLFAPGGIGVREYVLQWALEKQLAPVLGPAVAAGQAVVIALMLRLVWTVAELVLAGILYVRGKGRAP
jgi:uncharacterized membrane protein YbhN (UPF0104 family)